MAKFTYQTKNTSGQVMSAQIEAPNEVEARKKLKSQNIVVLKMAANRSSAQSQGGFAVVVPTRDILVFTRQFATLINAGVPIADSLKILVQSRRAEQLTRSLNNIRQALENGRRLTEAMAAEPKSFSRFYVNMVRAGEEAGVLDRILERLAVFLEQSEKLRKQVTSALVYPAVVLLVGSGVIWALLTYVIPIFRGLYANSTKQLPSLTKGLLAVSDTLNQHGLLTLGLVVGGSVLIFSWYRTKEGRETVESVLIDLPVIGEVVQKAAIARLTRTLATLLSSGISIIEALEIAAKTSGNVVVEKSLMRCREAVTNGRTLASPMAKEKIFPEMTVQMIAVGEHSGTLDQMLSKIADFYEVDVENAVKMMITLIEPLLILVLGGAVAFVLLAMYLPIFNIGSL